MLTVLCPGQGAQTPGMLTAWLEDPHAARLIDSYAEAAELDLVALGTSADAETIRDTAVAQPLLVAASLMSYRVLASRVDGLQPGAVAGHSVGELAALAVAGVLTDTEAVRLTAARGRAMANAAGMVNTGMAAVVGGDPDEVTAAITDAGLTAANVNGGGQIVAAGHADQLTALADNAPARARVVPLQVAGAFHTHYMEPAVADVDAVAQGLSPATPDISLLSNADGGVVTDGNVALARIVSQITSPVRWDLCSATLVELGTTATVELSPGGVLTKLGKRTMRGVPGVALSGPESLEAAADLITQEQS